MLAQQESTGAYAGGSVGMTALMTESLLGGTGGVPAEDPRMQQSLRWLVAQQQADGGIYSPQEGGELCDGIESDGLCRSWPSGPRCWRHRRRCCSGPTISVEYSEPRSGDINYGGIGYGSAGKGQEDLSNTGFCA